MSNDNSGYGSSERPLGIFQNRTFNMSSALSTNKVSKEPQTTTTVPKSPRNRTQRADYGVPKVELDERILKPIDLPSSKSAYENLTSLRKKFNALNIPESAAGVGKKMGDNLSQKLSNESISSDMFSLALETPLTPDELCQHESPQNLLKQGKSLTQTTYNNEDSGTKIQMYVNELNDRIMASEMSFKSKIKDMERAQEGLFAERLRDKNNEIKKLQSEIKELNSAKAPAHSGAAQLELEILGNKLRQKNEEIKKLMYKLCEAKTYIETLEKQKYSVKSVNPNVDSMKGHIKTIRKALSSNKKLIQMLQSKKHLSDLSITNDSE